MALDVVALDRLLEDKKKSDIARKMLLTTTSFAQKKNGQRRFTVEEALKLAEILGLTLDDMRELWKGA